MKHLRSDSRSDVQQEVERKVLEVLTQRFGVAMKAERISTGQSHAHLDGFAFDPVTETHFLVEVFAHVGRVKAAQRHKVHADVLKLALARSVVMEQGSTSVRAIVAFVCPDCARSLLGKTWTGDAAARFGVESITLTLDDDTRSNLIAAQAKQNLLNPDGAGVEAG